MQETVCRGILATVLCDTGIWKTLRYVRVIRKLGSLSDSGFVSSKTAAFLEELKISPRSQKINLSILKVNADSKTYEMGK